MTDSSRLTIWRFSDGRAGHDSQSRGLASALSRLAECDVYDVAAEAGLISAMGIFFRDSPFPLPDLLLGAGHKTHLPMLSARYKFGGKAIVLMRPGLPLTWFDCCFIPEHDMPAAAANIVLTKGALNPVLPAQKPDPGRGLLLIGGKSRHFYWDSDTLEQQVSVVLAHSNLSWLIVDSPRTPPATRRMLRSFINETTGYVPHESTAPDWLPAELQKAGTVWVSQDSISMIYESLSAGSAVGVFDLNTRSGGRLGRSIQLLASNNLITLFSAWKPGDDLNKNNAPLQEANRCAKILLETLSIKL